MSTKCHALVCALALLLGSALPARANPFDVNRPSRGEWTRMPEYCPDTLWYAGRGSVPTPKQARWIQLMGESFWNMHHYCWGVLKAARAEAVGIDKQTRGALYSNAIDEIHYVLDRAPQDFVLRPELLFRAGQFAVGADNLALGIEYFEQSIQAKADYWPPYLAIANVELGLLRRERALEWLRNGLAAVPGEPNLSAALERILSDKLLGVSARSSAAPR